MGVDLFPDVDFPIVTVSVPYEGCRPGNGGDGGDGRDRRGGQHDRRHQDAAIGEFGRVFADLHRVRAGGGHQRCQPGRAGQGLGRSAANLPRDIDPPIIEKFDPDSSPILAIVLSGPASVGRIERLRGRRRQAADSRAFRASAACVWSANASGRSGSGCASTRCGPTPWRPRT